MYFKIIRLELHQIELGIESIRSENILVSFVN